MLLFLALACTADDPVYSRVLPPVGRPDTRARVDSTVGDSYAGRGSLWAVGDVNGDGWQDHLFGEMDAGPAAYAGEANLYLGTADGMGSAPSWTLSGADTYDERGLWSILADVDGDGFDDAVVTDLGYTGTIEDQGRIELYLGGTSGLATSPTSTILGEYEYDYVARPSLLGDVNGDGRADIATSDYAFMSPYAFEGRAMVYYGTASGWNASPDWEKDGGAMFSYYGVGAEPAGDVDGDGYDDFLVASGGGDGTVDLYYGSATGLATTAGWSITGSDVGSGSGIGRSFGAGDVNGDGYDDLIIVDSGYENGELGEGRVLLYYGSATGPAATPAWSDEGDSKYNYYGFVAPLGDTNGDGYDDFAVASQPGSTTYTPFLRQYDGSATGPTETLSMTLKRTVSYTDFVRGMDVNDDGYGDLVINEEDTRADVYYGYVDADGDGSPSYEDCDDSDATIAPSAPEVVADGIDQDCDGGDTCARDSDGDGYGAEVLTLPSADLDCTDTGEASSRDDCNDGNAAINPAAVEVAGNNTDEDCDDSALCYVDSDGDGEGGATTAASTDADCRDVGELTTGTDCNDADASIYTGAAEVVVDGIDQDCDGGDVCTLDHDGDGFGGDDTVVSEDLDCADEGETGTSGDCDDDDDDVHPGASEVVGNGVDEDCDGAENCYTDEDDDGYGTSVLVASTDDDCFDAGEADDDGDCDDTDAAANPAGEEVPGDGIDGDCDGGESCYLDLDGDGHGIASYVDSADGDCADYGEAAAPDDCDETDDGVYPGAEELAGDGVDSDCDGFELCWVDGDGDGSGGAETVVSDLSCTGAVTTGGDCDDADATVGPTATELVADGIDQDCDGAEVCYADSDGDGFGGADTVLTDLACTGAATTNDDCDDAAADIWPGAEEVVADGVDSDCDGAELCWVDGDGDGHGGTETVEADLGCTGAAMVDDDCDDADPARYPDAAEVCDGVDQDCNGVADDGFPDTDADSEPDCTDDDDDGDGLSDELEEAGGTDPLNPDTDGDGTPDGLDATPLGGSDTGGAPGKGGEDGGCGCASTGAGGAGGGALVWGIALVLRRRRG